MRLMNQKKIRVGVLFGGKSTEHEISLLSAKNIIEAMDKDKYEIVLIGIDKEGQWHLKEAKQFLMHAENPKLIHLSSNNAQVMLVTKQATAQLIHLHEKSSYGNLDVIFPVLHGILGEDGTVQGMLKLAGIPFVGAGVLGSAIGMDKDVMKRLLRDANIPVARFVALFKHDMREWSFSRVSKELGLPFFVKPANTGSSVGVNKVRTEKEFDKAAEEAFSYDRKIIIEEFIKGREMECSVLGNEDPIASLVAEIIPKLEFYSYEAKYLDESGTIFKIPVELPPDILKRIQTMAIRAYKVLCCEGMGRVDFFLKENGDVIVNEINTIPGFTNMSPYPKLWQASGMTYTELVDRLIQLAIDRFEKEKKLKTFFVSS